MQEALLANADLYTSMSTIVFVKQDLLIQYAGEVASASERHISINCGTPLGLLAAPSWLTVSVHIGERDGMSIDIRI